MALAFSSLAFATLLVFGGCNAEPGGEPEKKREGAILVGAGDIARCEGSDDEATAKLVEGIPGTVFTLGDNAYQRGTPAEFEDCYGPSWGRHEARTMPAVGNHEYATVGAEGHFGYFGGSAGDPGKGYYSYDRGAWHVVVLNSNCRKVGGCESGSPQEEWLRNDLAADESACTLAYFHHPRFSSGEEYGDHTSVRPFWKALHEDRADVVLSAHEHSYERFAPQDPQGKADPEGGIRQFVVGTGGGGLYGFGRPRPNSEVRGTGSYGVLKLTLREDAYEWEFVPVAGAGFADSGDDRCVQ